MSFVGGAGSLVIIDGFLIEIACLRVSIFKRTTDEVLVTLERISDQNTEVFNYLMSFVCEQIG